MFFSGELPEQWLQLEHLPYDLRLAYGLAVDLDTLAERDQVRRGEQTGPQACRSINALEHRARRTFPVGASHMDEAQMVMRVARQRRQFARVRQTQLGAEPAQVVEELNGFGVGHRLQLLCRACNQPVSTSSGQAVEELPGTCPIFRSSQVV